MGFDFHRAAPPTFDHPRHLCWSPILGQEVGLPCDLCARRCRWRHRRTHLAGELSPHTSGLINFPSRILRAHRKATDPSNVKQNLSKLDLTNWSHFCNSDQDRRETWQPLCERGKTLSESKHERSALAQRKMPHDWCTPKWGVMTRFLLTRSSSVASAMGSDSRHALQPMTGSILRQYYVWFHHPSKGTRHSMK